MNNLNLKNIANVGVIILLMLGTFFLFRSCSAHADELVWDSLTYESQFEIRQFYTQKKLNPSDYAFYSKLSKEHQQKAAEHYNNARLVCWYLPRIPDQEKARICYTSAWAILGNTPQLKLSIMVLSLLGQYGLEAMKEWNYIQTNLHQSKYHFEMYEFYTQLLDRP